MPVEKALERLDKAAGTQFDPDVVREFCALVRERPDLLLGPPQR